MALARESERGRGSDGAEGVLHVVAGGAAERDRDVCDLRDRDHVVAVGHADHAALREHETLTALALSGQDGARGLERLPRLAVEVGEERDVAIELAGERDEVRVLRVEHRGAVRAHGMRDDALHARHRGEVVDAVEAEVVVAHVGDHGDVAVGDREAASQDPAARGLEDRELDVVAAEHRARGRRAGAVSALDELGADRDSSARGRADAASGFGRDPREETRGRRLAVRAGDERDRDGTERAPRDARDLGERALRERLGEAARAEADELVVPDERHVALARLIDHRDQARIELRREHRGDLVAFRLERQRRTSGHQLACAQRRPLAHLGAREHHVDRRFVRDDHAAGVLAHDRARYGRQLQRLAHAPELAAVGVDGLLRVLLAVEREIDDHESGTGEIVRPREPTRVDETHADRLSRPARVRAGRRARPR